MRDRGRAGHLERRGVELWEGDVLDASSLRGSGASVDVGYYLVHSMGRGSDGDFEARERAAAANFAHTASAEGVEASSTSAGSAATRRIRGTCARAIRRRRYFGPRGRP